MFIFSFTVDIVPFVPRPRETNVFHIQVNVEAEEKVTFELRYQELLQRKLGHYNHVIYVKPGEPIQDLRIDVDILESRAITSLKVPAIKNDLLNDVDITGILKKRLYGY